MKTTFAVLCLLGLASAVQVKMDLGYMVNQADNVLMEFEHKEH